MDKLVMYLSSADSLNVHPANSNTDFIVDLPLNLQLCGQWELALLELNRKNVYVYCDWCRESVIIGSLLPVLRKVNNEIQHILYIAMHPGTKNRIRLYIRDHSHKTPSFDTRPSTCTLLLRKCH